ncbi:MAG: hypothetical protein LBQ49_03135 [Rickettsiales bacterium]|nr:hypothetical protein [Rickettsiales bacterium]
MKRLCLSVVFMSLCIPCAFAAPGLPGLFGGGSRQGLDQVIYTDAPVDSYMATVEDVNFIPESEFMMRTDSLNYDQNIHIAREAEAAVNPGVGFAAKPVIACRDFGCTRLNDRITRAFLFNSLSNMFMMNSHSRLNICEADPFTRACLQSGISFPVRAGIASALVKIPRATINNVVLSTGLSKASVGITYEFLVNGIGVRCEPTVADIVIPANTSATLSNREFVCNMTTDGLTNVSLLLSIDYIDLDYGLLGGYYSFGLQGPTAGGGTGYALFKMEFANKARGAGSVGATTQRGAGSGMQTIRPGEYAVEPLEK